MINKNISLILNISLEYFYGIVDRMTEEDWQYLYFYSGRYIAKPNDNDLKLLNDLIVKYQRNEKLKNII